MGCLATKHQIQTVVPDLYLCILKRDAQLTYRLETCLATTLPIH